MAVAGALFWVLYGYIIGDKSDEDQDTSSRGEMGNPNLFIGGR